VFHQFMLYTPMPGTPLHRDVEKQGRLIDGINLADIHGQYKFNFKHSAISRDDSKTFLDRAFERDYEQNGPSLYRLMRNMFTGWQRYGRDADPRVRERVTGEWRQLTTGHGAALWAMEHYLRASHRTMSERIGELRAEIEREAGGWSRALNRALGPAMLYGAKRESRLGPRGRRLEPRTFIDRRHWAT
jgi:hypothetical protein